MKSQTRSRIFQHALVVVGMAMLAGCSKTAAPVAVTGADSIYFGGNIITINDAQPSAEAIAVKDGKIVAVGARAEIEAAQKGANTQLVDLGGRQLRGGPPADVERRTLEPGREPRLGLERFEVARRGAALARERSEIAIKTLHRAERDVDVEAGAQFFLRNIEIMSIGIGNKVVEFFSAATSTKVCR